jgi:hypothetical protein
MDKLTQYRQIVQEILKEYGEAQPAYGNIEVETIFDTERDHYQIVHVGWEGQNWVHICIIHIDIILKVVKFGCNGMGQRMILLLIW